MNRLLSEIQEEVTEAMVAAFLAPLPHRSVWDKAQHELMMKLANGKNLRSFYSPKNQEKFVGKVFEAKIDETWSMVFQIRKLNRNTFRIFRILIAAGSGEKGKVYNIAAGETANAYISIYGHFFDRLGERLYGLQKGVKREEYLSHFAADVINDQLRVGINSVTGECAIATPMGLGLGYYHNRIMHKTESLEILLKTFVSPDLFQEHQKEMYERLKNSNGTLDAPISIRAFVGLRGTNEKEKS